MAQTSDKTYLANSLTAIDPPLRKIIHYRQGRQEVCFEPVFPQSSQCTDRRSEFLLASTTVHPTYKISKSSPTYADIPCSLTSPQPTKQPRGELICPSKKIKPPPVPDTSDWSPPRAKIFSYRLHTAHSQPTAVLHTSPRPKPEARDQLQSYDLRRYIDTPVKKGGVSRGNDLFFHHVNNVQRDQAAQWEFPPHPGAACGRQVSFYLSLVFPLDPLHAPNLSRNLVAGVMSRLTMGWGNTGWE